MSHGFKLRYDQLRQGDPTGQPLETGGSDQYASPGNVRNLCFNWPDGKRMFLNYAYLIACEFVLEPDKNTIQLGFSSHTVMVQGFGLEALFLALLDHTPRFITMTDERYVMTSEQDMIITAIKVETN